MCGATIKDAVDTVYAEFYKNGKPNFAACRSTKVGTRRLPQGEWNRLREMVLDRDGFACTYCGDPDDLCADHVVPLSRNGTNEESNLVACCRPCNSSKRDKLLSEWGGRCQ
jgi:5-methylcytosine-specific restriction endonuclease McrA